MTIGERIQMLRKNNNLSQEDLAKKILVSRQTVSQWETDQTIPSIDNIYRLKEILNVSFDEILSDEKNEKEETEEEKAIEEYENIITREEMEFAVSKSSGFSTKKVIFGAVILLAYTIYCICTDSVNFFLGFLIGVFCLFLAMFFSFLKSKRQLMKRFDDDSDKRTQQYKLYSDRLESVVLKNGELLSLDIIRREDITAFDENDKYCTFTARNQIFTVNKKNINKSSLLYRFIYKDPKVKSVVKSKRTIWSVLLIIMCIAAPFVGFAIDASMSDYFDQLISKNLWVSFLLLPIPVLSVVYGIYQQKKGYRNSRNVIMGVIVFIILCAMGFSAFTASSEYYSDFAQLLKWEERLDVDFPDSGDILTQYPDAMLSEGVEGHNEVSIVRFEKKDAEEFLKMISQDERWVTEYPDNILPCFHEGIYGFNFDYHMLYNLTTDEVNKLPEKSGVYRFVYLKYLESDGVLEIEDYVIQLNIG